MTGGGAILLDHPQRRVIGPADVLGVVATGMKGAPRRDMEEVRWRPPDRREPATLVIGADQGAHQAFGVGVIGRRYSSPISAVSTISAAYMTETWSATSATTPRSWVIRIRPIPVCCCKSARSSMIWA